MKKLYLLILILIIFGYTNVYYAQDTIAVFHYNLLNYGLPVYGCDNYNNNPDDKDAYLRTITEYMQPDILTVNEMRIESDDTTPVDRILDNVLNIHFNPPYNRANITNLSSSYIINMLYYNTNKFTLYAQDVIPALRDINIYHLYYNSIDLEETNDTAYIHCIVTHLKSSTGDDNEAIRAEMTNSIMEYLGASNLGGNVLILGDFNVYSDQEQAFQNLVNSTNEEIQFYDPIESIGSWHDNTNYKNVHTQSTHISYNNCAAIGGMDDRFDFILMDKKIKNNENHYGYVNDSYTALGNDGTCFNESLLACENNDLSNELHNALYKMSDHLPIVLKLSIDQSPAVKAFEYYKREIVMYYKNPVKESLYLEIINKSRGSYKVQILSILGGLVLDYDAFYQINNIQVNHLHEGLYILHVIDPKGNSETRKIVITK